MQVQVSELVDRVLTAVDMEDGFTTPAMVVRWLNVAHPRFLFMLQISGWNSAYSQFDFTADGSDEYTLPEQAMSIAGVFRIVDEEPVAIPSENNLAPLSRAGSDRPRAYRAYDHSGDTKVALNPVQSSGDYSVRYLPHPAELVLADPDVGQIDYVDYPGGWEEWLVCEVARQASGREESINTHVEARQKAVEEDVRRMAEERLFADGPRIQNVDGTAKQPGWMSSSLLISKYRY